MAADTLDRELRADDEVLEKARVKIRTLVQGCGSGAGGLISTLDKYMVLYDGKEAARVDEVLEGSYESTVEYLRALSAEVSRFRDLQKDIKASVGGVHYFEMVAIDCDYVSSSSFTTAWKSSLTRFSFACQLPTLNR